MDIISNDYQRNITFSRNTNNKSKKLQFIKDIKIYLFNTCIKLFNLHKNFTVIDYYAAHKMCVNFFFKLLVTTFSLKLSYKKNKKISIKINKIKNCYLSVHDFVTCFTSLIRLNLSCYSVFPYGPILIYHNNLPVNDK